MRRQYQDDIARAERCFAGHQTSDRRARCFDFRDPKKKWLYAFSLSWTPGTLTLAGDLGELVVTHYSALWELEAGLSWAASADYDYLLGKTSRRPSFDRDETAQEIIRMANEGAREAVAGTRGELNTWRKERPARCDFPVGAEGDQEHAETVGNWTGDRPDVLAYREFRKTRVFGRFEWERMSERPVAPDGWELWFRLHEEFGYGEPKDIFRSAYRSQLKDDLEGRLSNAGADHAAELCGKLGLDDYYGAYRWTYHDLAQITAVSWGAKRALGWLEGERVYAWSARGPQELAA